MGMGFAPTWLRQVSPPASQNHFNHCLTKDIITGVGSAVEFNRLHRCKIGNKK